MPAEIPSSLIEGNLLLRLPLVEDIPLVVEAVRESISELQPWMDWAHPGYSAADARSWIESLPAGWKEGSQYGFSILDDREGTLLGGCGLNNINRLYRFANLGYWVRSSRTRQGVASRAARMVARFGFEHLGLVRAEIVVAVGNQASLRAAEKAGAHREGVLRNRIIRQGLPVDAVMHSLVPQDFGLQP